VEGQAADRDGSAGETACSPKTGNKRVVWDFRYNHQYRRRLEGEVALALAAAPPAARWLSLGNTSWKVTMGSETQTKTVSVEEDPRIQISASARRGPAQCNHEGL